jgi:hypothetical protein
MEISQYVRPLGFIKSELFMPSNAICYTSYNKGNHQVTYILTDVLKYNDVVRYNDSHNNRKGLQKRRFSYGMTVLKKYQLPVEVQFCFMTLLSLAFHLLRKWCRSNPCFAKLLDASFEEPSFEELCASIIQHSETYLSVKFTLDDMSFMLERSDTLFKKLTHLFFSLYPQ